MKRSLTAIENITLQKQFVLYDPIYDRKKVHLHISRDTEREKH